MFKNIVRVAMANIANFGSSFIVGFILPSVLTVAAYGHYKEYTLYMSFVYLFNLGFNDGIYIKYGGKHIDNLDKDQIIGEYNFIRVFQFIMFIPVLLFGLSVNDPVLIVFSFSSFFVTLITYHNNFLQATGRFHIFSNANILKSIIYISALLFGVFILKSDSYVTYIILSAFSYFAIFLYYEYYFYKDFGFKPNFSIKGKLSLFQVGIFILLANMSLTFVGNIGNWIVNFGFNIEDFAQYSFQNSILNVLLLIINSVGMVFFNVISKKEDYHMLRFTKKVCIFLGIFGGIGYFVFEILVNHFFPEYVESLSLLSITFIAIPYIMISKIIIANLYKSRKNEQKYLRDSILFAILSFMFVLALFLIFKNMIAIAAGTTIAYIVWFLYTSRVEYKFLSSNYKEIMLLVSHIVFFFISANLMNFTTGLIMYLIYCILVAVLFRKELLKVYQYAIK